MKSDLDAWLLLEHLDKSWEGVSLLAAPGMGLAAQPRSEHLGWRAGGDGTGKQ